MGRWEGETAPEELGLAGYAVPKVHEEAQGRQGLEHKQRQQVYPILVSTKPLQCTLSSHGVTS